MGEGDFKYPKKLSMSCVTYKDVIVVSLVLPYSNDNNTFLLQLNSLTPKVYIVMHSNM